MGYTNNKRNGCWVIYAINRKTKTVMDLVVGRRTKENVNKVISSILSLNPKMIYTDRLLLYKSLIPKSIHRSIEYGTNHIERFNLTLRTHIKRLNRSTICFSKSEYMLEACLNIYFWR